MKTLKEQKKITEERINNLLNINKLKNTEAKRNLKNQKKELLEQIRQHEITKIEKQKRDDKKNLILEKKNKRLENRLNKKQIKEEKINKIHIKEKKQKRLELKFKKKQEK